MVVALSLRASSQTGVAIRSLNSALCIFIAQDVMFAKRAACSYEQAA